MIDNNTSEMDGKETTLPSKKKNKSALDRGFPAGGLLVACAILIIIFHSILGWKIMNLDNERVAVEKMRILVEKDKNDFQNLKNELPSLKGQRDELKAELYDLEGEVTYLDKRRENLLKEKAKAEEIIERSKEADRIRNDLQIAVDGLKSEIQQKTQEISKLAGPNSQLVRNVDDLRDIISSFNTATNDFQNVFSQKIRLLEASSNTVDEAAIKLKERTGDFAQAITSNTNTFQNISNKAKNVTDKIQETETTLIEETKKLTERSQQFQTNIEGLNTNVTNIQLNNQQFANEINQMSKINSNFTSAAQTLQKLSENSRNLEEKFQEIQTPLNIVLNGLESSDIKIKTAANTLKAIVGKLETNTGNIITKITQIEKDTIALSEKIKLYDFSSLEKTASQKYEEKVAVISDGISANSEKISAFCVDIERRHNKLMGEIQTLEELLGKYKKQLEEKL